jgi:hypothetical protein
MGRSYVPVRPVIWTPGSPFRELTRGAQGLYLYLRTNPDVTPTGVQVIRPGKWACAAAGLTRAQAEADLAELSAAGWVLADYETDEVLLRWYMLDTGVTGNGNWMRTVPGLVALVESPLIRAALEEELAAGEPPSDVQPSLFDEGSSVPRTGGGRGGGFRGGPEGSIRGGIAKRYFILLTSSSSLTSTTSDKPRARTAKPAAKPAASALARFADWYAAYPRHTAPRKAEEAWARALERGADPVVLIAAAARYQDDPNREDRYTAMPATWLNQDRWDDDPLPSRNGQGPPAEQGVAPWE